MNIEENDGLEVVSLSSLEALERASTDTQISTAKKYPRVMSEVKSKMLSFATLDEETAASCFYSVPREGKMIIGKSARLAEIALSCYKNVRAGARVISEDGKTITAQGFCHDLENNVFIAVEVKRRITNKTGKRYSEDMIVTTGNAACSIALRNAALKVIPGALTNPVYEAARKVAVGDVKSLTTKRAQIIDRLKQMGINEERILARVECAKIEDVNLEKLEYLIGLGTSIKDGDSTTEEAFPLVKPPLVVEKDLPVDEKGEPEKSVSETPVEEKKVPKREPKANIVDEFDALLAENGIEEKDFMEFAEANGLLSDGQLSSKSIASLVKDWPSTLAETKKFLEATK